ncbi:50S ribosomal protein L22 [Morella rubra]|uniref:50S ribosomal protein L22 n=1 Tax=Morella rubra TaxID=262757 RepID=A0A6A1WFV8_9ROSI|nr:50S ribosomal protein L22 [Morella rubra]
MAFLSTTVSVLWPLGVSSSRKLLAESSEEAAISSPLTPVLAINSGKNEDQNPRAVSKPAKVQAVLKGIKQVIHSARANATHNHGLDPDRLLVAEAFLGKGFYKKRVSYHAKGKCGIKVRPECRLTVVVREMTAEEEAEIARLRVKNFRKLTKRERRLVPHKLIETTPIWNRKGKSNSYEQSSLDA